MPQADRWHNTPTALMGGVAIFAAVCSAVLISVLQTLQILAVIADSAAVFALGLLDAVLNPKPYQKLRRPAESPPHQS
jgi:UDP-N-acetylmuramyl pentapeptide phosphotransferase/UDP-N-acetylglucosamine-1-phosphate transferase